MPLLDALQVEKAPVVVKSGVSKADAEAMQKQLEAGAVHQAATVWLCTRPHQLLKQGASCNALAAVMCVRLGGRSMPCQAPSLLGP